MYVYGRLKLRIHEAAATNTNTRVNKLNKLKQFFKRKYHNAKIYFGC
jgi:hypothetical protein